MNSKLERQLWMVLIFMVMLMVFLMAFLLIFAGDDLAWGASTAWEKLAPFLPFLTGGLGFWLGFRAASGQVGKVMNTISMAVPGFVASAKLQTEMTKLERSRTIEQAPLPPSSRRTVEMPPVPYQQAQQVNPYQDVIDGYRGTLRTRNFDYLDESDYNQGSGGF